MRFPYGLADFATLIGEGYSYVDRTDRIPLIENAGRQLLFLRPRRFGKSLWLSTLENYYDLSKAGDFERLFRGLKIGQNPTPLYNRHFVLKLNFSVMDPSGDRVCVLPDNGIASFQSLMQRDFADALQALSGRELSVIPHGADLPPDQGTVKFHESWWAAGTRVRDNEVAPKG